MVPSCYYDNCKHSELQDYFSPELSVCEFFTLDIEATSIGANPPRMAVIETDDRLKNAKITPAVSNVIKLSF